MRHAFTHPLSPAAFLLAAGVVALSAALLSPAQAVPAGELVRLVPAGVTAGVIGTAPGNTPITAVPPNAFNPDAGLGLAKAGQCTDFMHWDIENESATPVYVCLRRGTTKANYTTSCNKRCNGCAGGTSDHGGPIDDAENQLFVIAGTSTDAGIQVALRCAQ
jgi:hypothetical protein